MNYIRGAVNAISAPYQYYKDLPPINPATLTGAIDVIVIQRPTDNGGTELSCSPFHVRFGKWQVLRPSEKKVTVSVNGHRIPFDMKIGEAGEAFFVFETEDDVPEDLVTSPLLRPSSPPADAAGAASNATDLPSDRFGTKGDSTDTSSSPEEPEFLDLNAFPSPPEEDFQGGSRLNANNVAPDFTPSSSPEPSSSASESPSTASRPNHNRTSSLSISPPNAYPEQHTPFPSLPSPPPSPSQIEKVQNERADAALKRRVGEVHAPDVKFQDGMALDAEGYHSREKSKTPETDSPNGSLSLHDRERSDSTLRAYDQIRFPSADDTVPHVQSKHTQYESHVSKEVLHSPPDSDSSSESSTGEASDSKPSPRSPSSIPLSMRAVSEPPPELSGIAGSPPTSRTDPTSNSTPAFPSSASLAKGSVAARSKLTILSPVQEYSWEWGAFPQPSPLKASFGKGGRMESALGGTTIGPLDANDVSNAGSSLGKEAVRARNTNYRRGKGTERALEDSGAVESDSDEEIGTDWRSRSVPPGLEGSPACIRRGDAARRRSSSDVRSDGEGDSQLYGAGGRLGVSKTNPTAFRVIIEGRKVGFELSLIEHKEHGDDSQPLVESGGESSEEEDRGRKPRDGEFRPGRDVRVRVFSPDGRLAGLDELETARLFEDGKISFDRFIEDGELVKDSRLVIKWAGQQYITRQDGSPLMDALVLWRSSYIERKGKRGSSISSRPVSPNSVSALSDDEQDDGAKSSEEGREKAWGIERSKSEPPEELKQPPDGGVAKPPTSSSWVQWWSRSRRVASSVPADDRTKGGRPELKEAFSAPVVADPKSISIPIANGQVDTGSAPALPSTPVQKAMQDRQTTPTKTSFSSPPGSPKKYAKTLRLTSEQLKSLNLKPGPNTITFSLSMTGAIACTARIFVWDSTDLVVISDIDGTITKSDGLGHVFAMIGRDWTHLGVAKLYTDICRNGYKILYLTSRAIGQADATRGYLKGIKQNDYQLPEGPVIMSPDRLMASLHREVIMRKPEVFKMACLRDIQRLFGEASRNPFYAGFGNRITDALSYRSVNVPSSKIFTIDSAGEVKCELLELAGYKSSYIHMTDLVDQMFPPIHRKWAPEFTDFNFWKTPVQEFPLPDFSPPSPALSARSDTSNQSTLARLRNFSLVGNRQLNVPRSITTSMSSNTSDAAVSSSLQRSSTLQQMSSFERLSTTLGLSGSPVKGSRSESPEPQSDSDDEEDEANWEWDAGGSRRRRQRRRSMTSMPGSLEDMTFDMDDNEEGDDIHDEEHEYDPAGEHNEMEGEVAEEVFDEDLLAAGEMKNVPFL